jgi:hypothetical protein
MRRTNIRQGLVVKKRREQARRKKTRPRRIASNYLAVEVELLGAFL